MPKGAGKKGDKPPRKRRCTGTVHTFTSMPAVPTAHVDHSNAAPPSSSGSHSPDPNPQSSSQPLYSGQEIPRGDTFTGYQLRPPYFSQLSPASGHYGYPYYSYPTMTQSQTPLGQSQSQCTPRYASPLRPPQRPSPLRDEMNPCTLKFVAGNICVCQSCRDSLRSSDGSPWSPPRDLCVARLGRRQ